MEMSLAEDRALGRDYEECCPSVRLAASERFLSNHWILFDLNFGSVFKIKCILNIFLYQH